MVFSVLISGALCDSAFLGNMFLQCGIMLAYVVDSHDLC